VVEWGGELGDLYTIGREIQDIRAIQKQEARVNNGLHCQNCATTFTSGKREELLLYQRPKTGQRPVGEQRRMLLSPDYSAQPGDH
jgi:hypothetical protein